MRIGDFGHLDGPVVLFGGPYSNLQAMQAMAGIIQDRAAICTGDAVAYCAKPNETVALLRSQIVHSIAGNCEDQVLDDADTCGCGFEENSTCDRLSASWWPRLQNQINDDSRNWFTTLPQIASFVHQNRRYAVIHGGATANNLFLWPSSPADLFNTEIAAIETAIGPVDGIIAGHCGIPFHRRIGQHQWINSGAIGLPPHDGRPETRYGVLDDGEFVIERLTYDHESARADMIAAGLTQGYHDTLQTGLWPSEDALAPELKR